eukprot:764660_1
MAIKQQQELSDNHEQHTTSRSLRMQNWKQNERKVMNQTGSKQKKLFKKRRRIICNQFNLKPDAMFIHHKQHQIEGNIAAEKDEEEDDQSARDESSPKTAANAAQIEEDAIDDVSNNTENKHTRKVVKKEMTRTMIKQENHEMKQVDLQMICLRMHRHEQRKCSLDYDLKWMMMIIHWITAK